MDDTTHERSPEGTDGWPEDSNTPSGGPPQAEQPEPMPNAHPSVPNGNGAAAKPEREGRELQDWYPSVWWDWKREGEQEPAPPRQEPAQPVTEAAQPVTEAAQPEAAPSPFAELMESRPRDDGAADAPAGEDDPEPASQEGLVFDKDALEEWWNAAAAAPAGDEDADPARHGGEPQVELADPEGFEFMAMDSSTIPYLEDIRFENDSDDDPREEADHDDDETALFAAEESPESYHAEAVPELAAVQSSPWDESEELEDIFEPQDEGRADVADRWVFTTGRFSSGRRPRSRTGRGRKRGPRGQESGPGAPEAVEHQQPASDEPDDVGLHSEADEAVTTPGSGDVPGADHEPEGQSSLGEAPEDGSFFGDREEEPEERRFFSDDRRSSKRLRKKRSRKQKSRGLFRRSGGKHRRRRSGKRADQAPVMEPADEPVPDMVAFAVGGSAPLGSAVRIVAIAAPLAAATLLVLSRMH